MKLSEVFKALEDGKRVEYKSIYDSDWRDLSHDTIFSLRIKDNYEFRIKENPMELWVNISAGNIISGYESFEQAKSHALTDSKKVAMHMREVVD